MGNFFERKSILFYGTELVGGVLNYLLIYQRNLFIIKKITTGGIE